MVKPKEMVGLAWANYVWWRTKRWAKKHGYEKKVSNWGICNCRKIAGSSSWSQHAFCNALDIGVKDKRTGDAVKKWLTKKDGKYKFRIKTLLWWVESHYDHVHINPKPFSGTPPCAK